MICHAHSRGSFPLNQRSLSAPRGVPKSTSAKSAQQKAISLHHLQLLPPVSLGSPSKSTKPLRLRTSLSVGQISVRSDRLRSHVAARSAAISETPNGDRPQD